VPKELEERGYTSAVVAQRLIDEIIRIGTVAATFNDQIAFSSLPFENKIPKIDVPVAGVSLATFVAQLRELVGIVDTRVSDFDSAQRMVQRLLDRGKAEDRRPAVNLGGVIALAQGRYEEALADTAAGDALRHLGDEARLDQAIDRFKRAVAVDPKFARAYFLQAQIHRDRNDYAQAAALLAHAIDADANNPDIYKVYIAWGE